MDGPDYYPVAIVSCDIVNHSRMDAATQLVRVKALNAIVAMTIADCAPGDVIWASGGDGGHVVLRQGDWQETALGIIGRLRTWSSDGDVPLRMTCHHGWLTHIAGADGRPQVIGEAINYAGWLLSRGDAQGIVVSDDFRRGMTIAASKPGLSFHDDRTLRHPTKGEQRLFLLSMSLVQSRWSSPIGEDHEQLNDALRRNAGWEVIYAAKRILQINTADPSAIAALHSIEPDHLRYADRSAGTVGVINPFLHHLESKLAEVVQLGHLVERRYNEVLCKFGDAGDTMFVILRGQIGVFDLGGRRPDSPAEPAFTHQEGEIVGELAFTLGRTRTAKLVALTDVALLSFNYLEVSTRLAAVPTGELGLTQISRFITRRVLEHSSSKAAYLLGPDREGPLAEGGRDWKPTLNHLHNYTDLLHVDVSTLHPDPDSGTILEIADIRPHEAIEGRDGLYILVAGSLLDRERNSVLDGENFPVMWIDVPGLPRLSQRSFVVDSDPVKVLRIAAQGILSLDRRQVLSLSRSLRREMAEERVVTPKFDIFLSYAHHDLPIVRQVIERLRAAGIRYWVDTEQIAYGDFLTQKIEQGLRGSRYLVLCVSPGIDNSDWIADEWGPILNAELNRRSTGAVIPLMLGDSDEGLPLMLADKHKLRYADEDEFEAFLHFLVETRSGRVQDSL